MPKINENINKTPFYLTKRITEETKSEPNVINLSIGEAGFRPSLKIYKEAKRIINPNDETLFKYEKIAGSKELRKSIASWYKEQFNLDINPNSVVITDGGTGGTSLSFKFLTNPGGQIIIPDPAYPPYMVSAGYDLENRIVERIPIGNGKLTRELLEPFIKNNTELVILTSPHNPTGVVYDEKILKDLVDLAKKKDFFIFYDEDHFPEVYDNRKHLPIQLFDRENTVSLGSLSRLSLQGGRIGWVVLPENLSEKFSLTYSTRNLSVNTAAQKLASFVLDNYKELGFDKEFKKYEEKRDWFVSELNKFEGFECHIPEGACYVFPNIKNFVEENRGKLEELVKKESEKRKRSDEDIEFALAHNSMLMYKFLLYCAGVGGLPGIAYGPNSDDNIRLTFSVKKEDVIEAVNRMKDMYKLL